MLGDLFALFTDRPPLEVLGFVGWCIIGIRAIFYWRDATPLEGPPEPRRACGACNGWGRRYVNLFAKRRTSRCPACRAEGDPSAELLRINSLSDRTSKQAAELSEYKSVLVPKLHARITELEARLEEREEGTVTPAVRVTDRRSSVTVADPRPGQPGRTIQVPAIANDMRIRDLYQQMNAAPLRDQLGNRFAMYNASVLEELGQMTATPGGFDDLFMDLFHGGRRR